MIATVVTRAFGSKIFSDVAPLEADGDRLVDDKIFFVTVRLSLVLFFHLGDSAFRNKSRYEHYKAGPFIVFSPKTCMKVSARRK